MRKPYSFLLVWFSYLTPSFGLDDSQLSGTTSEHLSSLTGKFTRLRISLPDEPGQDTLRTYELIRSFVGAEKYGLRELDEALKLLIDIKKMNVAETSIVLLNSPLFHDLTESILDEAVWHGCHHFLRCLQNKMLRTLPPVSLTSAKNLFKNPDKRMLHKLFAYSYERSWYEPLLWKEWLNEMDWAKFWEVIFEVDNVKLFEDLFTQKLFSPFDRVENLEKSKLSKLVGKHQANKIGAYLGISRCKDAITFDKDGRLDVNLLQWDNGSGRPLFDIKAIASVAIKSRSLRFLSNFVASHPKRFPFHEIATETLLQARFNIFYWVYDKSPEETLKGLNLDLGILGSDHLEERRELLRWIFKQLPEWVPHEDTIRKLRPELLMDAYEHNSNICPKQNDFRFYPSYGMLKWALTYKPEWIFANMDVVWIAAAEYDLDLLRFVRTKCRKYPDMFLRLGKEAAQVGDVETIDFCIKHHGKYKQAYLRGAAVNGHVKALEELATMGYRLDFADEYTTLVEIANSDHIHVMEYIHKEYPEIFKDRFNIDKFLGRISQSTDRTSEMLEYLYELFTPENINLSLDMLVGLMRNNNVAVFDWLLERHSTIFEDEIKKDSENAHEKIKLMVWYAAIINKNQERVEFLMNQARDKLKWESNLLSGIARAGALYLLDRIYEEQKENVSLWDPLSHFADPMYLQWYHSKVGDLPWEGLAYNTTDRRFTASLYWILTKRPNIGEAVLQQFIKRYGDSWKYIDSGIVSLLTKGSDGFCFTPENAALIKDEISLYYHKYELSQSHQPMETMTTL